MQVRVQADLWGLGRACAGAGVTCAGVALVGAVGVGVAANRPIDGFPCGQGDEGLDVLEVEVPIAGVLKPDGVLVRACAVCDPGVDHVILVSEDTAGVPLILIIVGTVSIWWRRRAIGAHVGSKDQLFSSSKGAKGTGARSSEGHGYAASEGVTVVEEGGLASVGEVGDKDQGTGLCRAAWVLLPPKLDPVEVMRDGG